MESFDVIWIGTGQATMTVVPRLLNAGKRVAIVEGNKFGGTCVNFGCTPTKTLVASARAVNTTRRGEDFGFSVENLNVHFQEVMRPQKENRDRSSEGIKRSLANSSNCTVFEGYGSFVNETTINVASTKISGETIVIHTGTRPVAPNLDGIESIDWLNNERILDLEKLPQHLIVVGGSYIALEFAQLFWRLGSKITVLERSSRIVFREDPDISELVAQTLANEDFSIKCSCNLERVSNENGVTAYFVQEGAQKSVSGSHILFGVGRMPNSDKLNVDAAGIEVNQRGHIQVNEHTQTNKTHIFAIGDVNGRGAFTHTSVNDGETFWDFYARQNGLSAEDPKWDRKISDRTLVYSMFIAPPLSRVGMSESQARESGRPVLKATLPMSRIARAREKRETDGMVKILVDAETEEFLGVTIFGVGGDEIIGTFAAFMALGGSYKQFRRVVFPHPTVSELMPWVLDGLKPLE